jgi:hypothetical protein
MLKKVKMSLPTPTKSICKTGQGKNQIKQKEKKKSVCRLLIRLMMEFGKKILNMLDTIQKLSGLLSCTLSRTLKIKIYRTIILPFVCMGVKHCLLFYGKAINYKRWKESAQENIWIQEG